MGEGSQRREQEGSAGGEGEGGKNTTQCCFYDEAVMINSWSHSGACLKHTNIEIIIIASTSNHDLIKKPRIGMIMLSQ